jgi:hypothetical protein
MTQAQVLGIVRHALTFVGGILVVQGYVTDASFLELSGLITAAIGAVWSVVDKTKNL